MIAYKRILIVDDDPGVLFVFRETLGGLGKTNQVVAVASGIDALTQFKNKPFDLIITDLRMPDMDGVTLTEAIKALNPRAPVVWVTAYGSYNYAADAERLGVTACCDKALEVWQLLQLVRDALSEDD